MSKDAQVKSAAAVIVDHFGSGRVAQYFECFAPDADFIFYTHTERIVSRIAYVELWKTWENEMGFKVLGCASTNQNVRLIDENNAIFTHDVASEIQTNDGTDTVLERETIVFTFKDDKWVAVHEHLSPRT